MEPLEFRYDTQLLIEGQDLDEDEINDYITKHFKGDCLLAVGDEELIKISEKVLQSGNFKGPVTIQYLRDKKSGATYLMEINPRLGGGVITSIEAGADITEFILRDFLGEELQPFDNWEDKMLMTRYFKEVIFHANNH